MASSSAASWPSNLAGVWIGESRPDESLQHDTPVNPINWSLALVPDQPANGPSAFGAGFFSDAGDIPDSPVLTFTIMGKWDAVTGAVSLTKSYTNRNIPEELKVEYTGQLHREPDDRVSIKGKWANALEGTFGVFACLLEPPPTAAEIGAAHVMGLLEPPPTAAEIGAAAAMESPAPE